MLDSFQPDLSPNREPLAMPNRIAPEELPKDKKTLVITDVMLDSAAYIMGIHPGDEILLPLPKKGGLKEVLSRKITKARLKSGFVDLNIKTRHGTFRQVNLPIEEFKGTTSIGLKVEPLERVTKADGSRVIREKRQLEDADGNPFQITAEYEPTIHGYIPDNLKKQQITVPYKKLVGLKVNTNGASFDVLQETARVAREIRVALFNTGEGYKHETQIYLRADPLTNVNKLKILLHEIGHARQAKKRFYKKIRDLYGTEDSFDPEEYEHLQYIERIIADIDHATKQLGTFIDPKIVQQLKVLQTQINSEFTKLSQRVNATQIPNKETFIDERVVTTITSPGDKPSTKNEDITTEDAIATELLDHWVKGNATQQQAIDISEQIKVIRALVLAKKAFIKKYKLIEILALPTRIMERNAVAYMLRKARRMRDKLGIVIWGENSNSANETTSEEDVKWISDQVQAAVLACFKETFEKHREDEPEAPPEPATTESPEPPIQFYFREDDQFAYLENLGAIPRRMRFKKPGQKGPGAIPNPEPKSRDKQVAKKKNLFKQILTQSSQSA